MPVLNVENLGIGYRNSENGVDIAVDGIEFSVNKGEAVGIVGESGCGKSTVARALMGYLRPGGQVVSGKVHLIGDSILELPVEKLQKIRGRTVAIVPQNPLSSLTYHMTVGSQLNEILRVHRGLKAAEARIEALSLFKATRLPDPEEIYGRYPHQISGGQRQRVVIATALACRPALMILDEPTTALDTTTEMQVLKLVKDLRRDVETAIVYITHDLTLTNYMCDRVLVMHNGKIVEEGSARTIFERPRTPYTRQLVDAIPRVDQPPKRERIPETQLGEHILEVKELSFAYGPQWSLSRLFRPVEPPRAVEKVSFHIRRMETLGLVGESGSGKSTVANIVAGLLGPTQGEVRFAGNQLHPRGEKRSIEDRRRIQLIFQDPLSSLNPRHRVGAILTRSIMGFLGVDRRHARDKAIALLEELELPSEFMNRYPRQLSGGQQQRVAIARAFAADPDVIICDEITSALDVSVQAHVLDLLMALQRKNGTACLFISHDLGVIREVAHRAVVMRHGKIVEMGPTEALFENSRNSYTRHLIAAAQRRDDDDLGDASVPEIHPKNSTHEGQFES
jgi:peptide/nickel transport system ATP-binding protein